MKKKILDDKLLRKMWYEENKTLIEISEIVGASTKTVHKRIKELNLIRCYSDKDWLYQKHYVEKMNITQMASLAQCGVDSIRNNMYKHGVPISMEIVNQSKTKYHQNDNYFSSIDTEEKAYWLGFIIADGCITDHNGLDLTIVQSISSKHHLEKFTKAIESNRCIEEYSTTLSETAKTYPMCRITIRSKKICEDLISLGVTPRKSMMEKFPSIKKEFTPHLIRGIFDGDGSFSCGTRMRRNEPYASFNIVGSYELLSGISSLVSEAIGIKMNVLKKQNIYVIRTTNHRASRVMDWMYHNATVYLERKKAKQQEWLSLWNRRYSPTSGEN